jgi:hypothetical protein
MLKKAPTFKKSPFSAATAFLTQQVSDKMMHCKRNIEALTVKIVHG